MELNTQKLGMLGGPGLWARQMARGTYSAALPAFAQPAPLAASAMRAWFVAAAPAPRGGSADDDASGGPGISEYMSGTAQASPRRQTAAPGTAFGPRQLSRWAGLRPSGRALLGPELRAPSALGVRWGAVRERTTKGPAAIPDAGYLRGAPLVPSMQRLSVARPVRESRALGSTTSNVRRTRRGVERAAFEVEGGNDWAARLRDVVNNEGAQLEERLLRKQRLDMHR